MLTGPTPCSDVRLYPYPYPYPVEGADAEERYRQSVTLELAASPRPPRRANQ